MSITIHTGATAPLLPQNLPAEAPPALSKDLRNSAPVFDTAARLDKNSNIVRDVGNYAINDTDASGRDAAAAMIQELENGDDKATRAQYFNEQIEAHKDDPEWLAEYFGALGEDRVAELMGLSVTATANSHDHGGFITSGNADALGEYQNTVGNLRTALDTLEKNGYLTQADMTALYKSLDLDRSGGAFGPTLVSDLFANSSPEVQELFFNAAMAEGNDKSVAIASHVLASMPVDDQARILGNMSQQELDSFVEMSMKGQFEAIDMQNYYGEGDTYSTVTIGGISEILANANDVTVYSHARIAVPDYPPHLQTALFDATAGALTNQDVFDKFADDVQFKDELAVLASTEHDDFLDRALDADGGPYGEDLGSTARNEYSKVLEMTLFTPPLPDSAEGLLHHIDGRFMEIGDDLANLDDAAFEDKYGRNRGAMAAAYGQMTGVFFEALDSGLTGVKDDAGKAAEIMDPLFKLIDFGVGKGLSKAGPIGAVLSKTLDMSGASTAVKNDIKEMISSGQIAEAIQEMKDHGVDLSELGEELYEHMSDNVLPNRTGPNGTYQGPNGDVSIKDAWQNGYDFVQGAPTTE